MTKVLDKKQQELLDQFAEHWAGDMDGEPIGISQNRALQKVRDRAKEIGLTDLYVTLCTSEELSKEIQSGSPLSTALQKELNRRTGLRNESLSLSRVKELENSGKLRRISPESMAKVKQEILSQLRDGVATHVKVDNVVDFASVFAARAKERTN